MLFNSWPFLLIFLPLVLGSARLVKGRTLLGLIVFASLIFYGFAGHIWFLIPMIVTTCLDFFLGPLIERASSLPRRRALLLLSLIGNLGLLAYFKYARLFAESVFSLVALRHPTFSRPAWSQIFDVILPAGISFYTFQTMSYVIDVYRGTCPAERSFLRFAGFVWFFPHLVAGPLTRHNQLIPQLERIETTGIRPRWQEGLFLFAIGLCKKVLIADRIASLMVDPIIAHYSPSSNMTFLSAWIAMLGYTMQIYFDFSGYSDMAIGLGRLFNIELPQNFDSPYKATNPSEFWRKWHITLSSWLRDYLYISLGGNRRGALRRNVNLMITMILGGLWHGANWTFAVWGALHGSYLILFHLNERRFSRMPPTVQRMVTFLGVCIAWIFFRSERFGHAFSWLKGLVGWNGVSFIRDWRELAGIADLQIGIPILALAFMAAFLAPKASESERLGNLRLGFRVGLGVATSVSLVFMNYSSKFLYFQF